MERVLQQAMFKMPGSGEKKMTLTTEMVKASLYSKPSSGGGTTKKSKTNVA
jgi:ATP-dependent Clp protease ATP-binding subunit ClpX